MKVILLFLFGIPLLFVCFGLVLGAVGLLLVLAVKFLMEPGRV